MHKKTVLVTGANGFIGGHFVRKYQDEYDIRAISLQKTPLNEINFKGVEVVLHLAALAQQSKKISWNDYYAVNTVLTEKLAVKAKEAGVAQFIFFSTIKVFGSDGDLENHQFTLNEDSETKPQDFYGESKLLAEQSLFRLQDRAFKVAVIRPAMVYGEGIKGNMLQLMKLIEILPILPFDYASNRRSIVGVKNLLKLTELVINRGGEWHFYR